MWYQPLVLPCGRVNLSSVRYLWYTNRPRECDYAKIDEREIIYLRQTLLVVLQMAVLACTVRIVQGDYVHGGPRRRLVRNAANRGH